MKIKKIKLVKVPQIESEWLSLSLTSPYLPPLALANITSYLRKKKFYIDQDDLNQKVHYYNFRNKDKLNIKLLNDSKKILSFLNGKKEKKVKKFLNKIVELTNFENFDLYMLSLGLMRISLDPPPEKPFFGIKTYLRSTTLSALLLCKYIKENYRKTIILGGDINQEILYINSKLKLFDFAILGPGEEASYKLIKALNSEKDFTKIKGLIYWNRNKIIRNQGGYKQLLIKPDFKGLPLETYYWEPSKKIRKIIGRSKNKQILIIPLKFIDGCINKCIYCPLTEKVRYLEPKKVAEIIKDLKKEYKTENFMFLSNTLNISKGYINNLCDEFIKKNLKIKWTDSFRTDNLDKKLIQKLKEAGCIRMVIGLETASSRLLSYINKNISLEYTKKILKEIDKSRLWIHLNFITGFPHETNEDINDSLRFIKENKNKINDLHVTPFRLFKRSLMFKYPQRFGIKNVKEIYNPKNFSEQPINKKERRYSFDEISGLKWEEKSKQIIKSKNKILYCSPIKTDPFLEGLPLLFYLYSFINKKKKIVEIRTKIIKKLSREYFLRNPILTIKKLTQFQNIYYVMRRVRKYI